MKGASGWFHALVYCVLAACIGAFVGAVAGVGVAGLLLRPEEAAVLVTGVCYGAPVGAVAGLTLGAVAMVRRGRVNRA